VGVTKVLAWPVGGACGIKSPDLWGGSTFYRAKTVWEIHMIAAMFLEVSLCQALL